MVALPGIEPGFRLRIFRPLAICVANKGLKWRKRSNFLKLFIAELNTGLDEVGSADGNRTRIPALRGRYPNR